MDELLELYRVKYGASKSTLATFAEEVLRAAAAIAVEHAQDAEAARASLPNPTDQEIHRRRAKIAADIAKDIRALASSDAITMGRLTEPPDVVDHGEDAPPSMPTEEQVDIEKRDAEMKDFIADHLAEGVHMVTIVTPAIGFDPNPADVLEAAEVRLAVFGPLQAHKIKTEMGDDGFTTQTFLEVRGLEVVVHREGGGE